MCIVQPPTGNSKTHYNTVHHLLRAYRVGGVLGRVRRPRVAFRVSHGEVAAERDTVELPAPHAPVRVPAVVFCEVRPPFVGVGPGKSPRRGRVDATLSFTDLLLEEGQRVAPVLHDGHDYLTAVRHGLERGVHNGVDLGDLRMVVQYASLNKREVLVFVVDGCPFFESVVRF